MTRDPLKCIWARGVRRPGKGAILDVFAVLAVNWRRFRQQLARYVLMDFPMTSGVDNSRPPV